MSPPPLPSPLFRPSLLLHSSLCLHCPLASGFTQSQMRKGYKCSQTGKTAVSFPPEDPSPSTTFPTWSYSDSPHPSSCAPLKNKPLPSRISLFPIVTQCITLPGPYARLFTWQAPIIPVHLPSLFFTSMSEILGSFCSRDLLSDTLPESRRLQAQISWCIFQS